MEFGNSVGSEKSKNEYVRIPSPASVSSVHSIRPLEWDSGADIGYEFKHQSGLSTVERIALKSGTLNLLESCISRDTSTNRSNARCIGNPLAQSSPFIVPIEITAGDVTPPSVKINQCRPLVDYTINEYSIDEKVEKLESDIPVGVEVLRERDRTLKLRSDENSKSLDDLRILGCKRRSRAGSTDRSRSSQNLLTTACSEKNSSSSLATLIPSRDEFPHRKYSDKSVQVDDVCLIRWPQTNKDTSPKSILEFFRKISNEDTNDDDSRNMLSNRGSKSNNCTDEESMDGGSFEYVPGSRYISQTLGSKCTSDTGSKDAGSLNSWCSEVTDGVALLTKYVNDLNVSNKHQVIEKVAKSLMNHLSQFGKSSKVLRVENLERNLLLNSSPELNVGIRPYSTNSTESETRMPNLKNSLDSSSSHYVESSISTKDSLFSTSLSAVCVSSKGSSRLPASSNSSPRDRSCSIKTESNYKADSKSSNSNQGSVSAQSFSLKEYLKSERDVQLMWIKSNIDHLNNLRKLCESHKVLHKKSNALKKPNSTPKSAKNSSQPEVLERRLSRKKQSIVKSRPTVERQGSSAPTSDNKRSCGSYGALSTSESVNKTSMKIISNSRYNVEEQKRYAISPSENVCSCSCKCCFRESNKENVLTNVNGISRCRKSLPSRKSKCISASTQPISYTILFDKGPNFGIGEHFKVKEYIKQKSSSITHKRKKITRTESIVELQSVSDDMMTDQIVSLQDYLINNKPEYVNRAEYRRQCLAEIAKLRELRDRSRKELLSAVQNVGEINDVVKSVAVPPPLTVIRIFDDKTIKEETKKKYQQLPEVQNKKVELQRRNTYRRNHMMAKVYTKKLQKKVLRGQINLANNVNVLSI